jgi:hypothetical protein
VHAREFESPADDRLAPGFSDAGASEQALGDAAVQRGLMVAPEASAGDVGQPDIFIKDRPWLSGFAGTKAPVPI